jgi:hypothetical protein
MWASGVCSREIGGDDSGRIQPRTTRTNSIDWLVLLVVNKMSPRITRINAARSERAVFFRGHECRISFAALVRRRRVVACKGFGARSHGDLFSEAARRFVRKGLEGFNHTCRGFPSPKGDRRRPFSRDLIRIHGRWGRSARARSPAKPGRCLHRMRPDSGYGVLLKRKGLNSVPVSVKNLLKNS